MSFRKLFNKMRGHTTSKPLKYGTKSDVKGLKSDASTVGETALTGAIRPTNSTADASPSSHVQSVTDSKLHLAEDHAIAEEGDNKSCRKTTNAFEFSADALLERVWFTDDAGANLPELSFEHTIRLKELVADKTLPEAVRSFSQMYIRLCGNSTGIPEAMPAPTSSSKRVSKLAAKRLSAQLSICGVKSVRVLSESSSTNTSCKPCPGLSTKLHSSRLFRPRFQPKVNKWLESDRQDDFDWLFHPNFQDVIFNPQASTMVLAPSESPTQVGLPDIPCIESNLPSPAVCCVKGQLPIARQPRPTLPAPPDPTLQASIIEPEVEAKITKNMDTLEECEEDPNDAAGELPSRELPLMGSSISSKRLSSVENANKLARNESFSERPATMLELPSSTNLPPLKDHCMNTIPPKMNSNLAQSQHISTYQYGIAQLSRNVTGMQQKPICTMSQPAASLPGGTFRPITKAPLSRSVPSGYHSQSMAIPSTIRLSKIPSLTSLSSWSSSTQGTNLSDDTSLTSSHPETLDQLDLTLLADFSVPCNKRPPSFRSSKLGRKASIRSSIRMMGARAPSRIPSNASATHFFEVNNPNNYCGAASMSGPYPSINSWKNTSNELPKRKSNVIPMALPYAD